MPATPAAATADEGEEHADLGVRVGAALERVLAAGLERRRDRTHRPAEGMPRPPHPNA